MFDKKDYINKDISKKIVLNTKKNSKSIAMIFGILFFFSGISLAQDSCPVLEEEIFVQVQDCDKQATACFPVTLENILTGDVNITVNGVNYNDSYMGCDFDSTIIYNYFTLLGAGEAGPYRLDSWTVNANTFFGEFPDIPALVDSMNIWDPTGDWVQDATNSNIVGGNLDNSYSAMMIEQLQLPGTFAELGRNYAQAAIGSTLSFSVGIHEVIITNTTLNCADTTIITVACTPTEYINQTVYLGLPGTICLDDADLLGNVVSMENCEVNPTLGLLEYYPNEEDLCIDYTSLNAGNEMVCYVICDDLGICDTTYINFQVVLPPEGEVIVETILLGESETICLSAEDLVGNEFTILNACPESSGENVSFDFENGSLCVQYTGLSVGLDTACIIYCDNLGGCDSTIFYIATIDPTIYQPIAISDIDTTNQNETIMIPVADNDTISYISSLIVLAEATNGSTYVTMDNQISYEPNEDFCGVDQFEYIICNNQGCDTAMVSVITVCDEIKVYTGFSPNDDGVNDRFRIGGIEMYPNCSIQVFNAWGNRIYKNEEGKGYSNETGWDGTWNGKHLPDGNFFYTIELNDGTGKMMSGYVLVHR